MALQPSGTLQAFDFVGNLVWDYPYKYDLATGSAEGIPPYHLVIVDGGELALYDGENNLAWGVSI